MSLHRVRSCLPLLLVALSGGCGRRQAEAMGRDTVFVLPGSHLDLGFTAPISMVREKRIEVLDHAIAAAERDSGFVWFEEGGWVIEEWLDHYHDHPERIAALRRLVMRRQIGIGATLLGPHAAAFPEALGLLTTHLDRVERELGLRPEVAVINDVPALPEQLVDALAQAGIKYLLASPNLTFSPALPAAVVRQPFYWESSSGARVLVYMDSDGYMSASAIWGLPPECAAAMSPQQFPEALGADGIIVRGVQQGLARRGSTLPLMIVQDAYDNWDTQCAELLPAAVQRNGVLPDSATLVLATPEQYFRHVEERFASSIPVRRGDWGGDWDLLRATEPVWSWRLREAMRQVTPGTPEKARIALVMAMDHNVGLGPRWMGGLPAATAMQHVREVADLYREAVAGVMGTAGTTAVPASLPPPVSGADASSWNAMVGDPRGAARVRAGGPGFLHPMIFDTAATIAIAPEIRADSGRMVVSVRLDRGRLEAQMGNNRFGAVIEVRLNAPISQVRLAPANSPDAIAGEWLLGSPPETVIAPAGVRVLTPGFSLTARGPLIIGWSLMADPMQPGVTWLQGLAFIDALEGNTDTGKLRRPFAVMYPGEPASVSYEIELIRAPGS